MQRAICCWIFAPALPEQPAASVRGLLLRRLHPGVDAVNAGDGTSPVLRVLDELPAAGTVVDDEGLHSTRFLSDCVVLTGVGGVRESHYKVVVPDVHRAVDPIRRYVANRSRCNLNGTDFALRS